jgi:hypothetical protein
MRTATLQISAAGRFGYVAEQVNEIGSREEAHEDGYGCMAG